MGKYLFNIKNEDIKIRGFLSFPVGIETEHWLEMGFNKLLKPISLQGLRA